MSTELEHAIIALIAAVIAYLQWKREQAYRAERDRNRRDL